jgi:hypothetical protein
MVCLFECTIIITYSKVERKGFEIQAGAERKTKDNKRGEERRSTERERERKKERQKK